MNNVLQTIIQYVYTSIFVHVKKYTTIDVSRKGINLKCRGYNKILVYTNDYNLSNENTLTIWVCFYFIWFIYKK